MTSPVAESGLRPNAPNASPSGPKPQFWIGIILMALLTSAGLYILLPMMGMESIGNLFSFTKVSLLIGGAVGALSYFYYWQLIGKRPHLLIYLVAIYWPVMEWVSSLLRVNVGFNTRMQAIMLAALMLPGIIFMFQNFKTLRLSVPAFLPYFSFFVVLTGFFLFFNANAADPNLPSSTGSRDNSIAYLQYMAYAYCLISVAVSGVGMLKHPNPRKLFDNFNTIFLIVTGIEAAMTVVGYPFHWLSMPVDGFLRAHGLFSHPNPFAHHMGIIMIYLLGLLCYYQSVNAKRIPRLLLFTAIGFNAMVFLLALSKTAFAVVGFCTFLFFLFNLSSPIVRKIGVRMLLGSILVVPLALLAFQLVSGQSFSDIITARLEQTESLVWRQEVWGYILSALGDGSVFWGHGFTAANMVIYQFSYHALRNPNPLMLVHNGYISLIYDLGIVGYLVFLAAVIQVIAAVKLSFRSRQLLNRPLLIASAAMGVYFLIVCAADEMVYMFDAPILYWTLSTMLFVLGRRDPMPLANETNPYPPTQSGTMPRG